MKDAASCEKPRGAASRLRSVDFRVGQPTCFNRQVPYAEIVVGIWGDTRGTETSKYPEEKKAKAIP